MDGVYDENDAEGAGPGDGPGYGSGGAEDDSDGLPAHSGGKRDSEGDDEAGTPATKEKLKIRLPPRTQARPQYSDEDDVVEVLSPQPARPRKATQPSRSRPTSFHEREAQQFKDDSDSDARRMPTPAPPARYRRHRHSSVESDSRRSSSPDGDRPPKKRSKSHGTSAPHSSRHARRSTGTSSKRASETSPPRRGRPPKPAAPVPEPVTYVFYHLSLELPGRPSFTTSKTKGTRTKVSVPEPEVRGPVGINTDMDWEKFNKMVAKELGVRVQQLAVDSFRWRSGWDKKPPPPRPLTNALGLDALHSAVLDAAKAPKAPTLLEATLLMVAPRLLRVPYRPGEGVAGFVDDTALVAIGDSFEETNRKLRHMYLRPNGALEWATSHFSRFEPSKFKLMHFSRAPEPAKGESTDPPRPATTGGPKDKNKKSAPRAKRRRLARPVLDLGRTTRVKPVHTHRFLGVIWDDQLRWTEQSKQAAAKGRAYALQVRRLARTTYGLRPKYGRRLYLSVVIPKMLYAVDVWGLPIPQDIPSAAPSLGKRQGAIGALRRLCAVQRIAALTITGGLRSSPNDLLDIHAQLLPMRLLVARLCFRALTRISALPPTHPLHDIAIASAAAFPALHRSPLQYLYHLFPELTPERIEKIVPMRHNPAVEGLAFTTHIAESREDSQKENTNLSSTIQVYTDGSGYKGYAGAAALLVRTDGIHKLRRTLRYRLGPLTEHTVYEAEAVGILLGLHLIETEDREFAAEPSSISLDNQAVIRATEHAQRAQPGHYLLDAFRDKAAFVHWYRNDERYSLEVLWVSGHDNAELNEVIDKQAKLAAEGNSSAPAHLPPQLRGTLRVSVSAARQEYARRLNERWQQDWRMSPRYLRHRSWAPEAATKAHMRATAELTRRESSTLFQLRSGHAPLNAHLHRIGCVPSPMCSACSGANETVEHFLYECEAHALERATLRAGLGKHWRDHAFLLGDAKGVKAALAYVRTTGRWRRGAREAEGARPEDTTGEARKEDREMEYQEYREYQDDVWEDEGESMELESDDE